jgi:hypothetical protein
MLFQSVTVSALAGATQNKDAHTIAPVTPPSLVIVTPLSPAALAFAGAGARWRLAGTLKPEAASSSLAVLPAI